MADSPQTISSLRDRFDAESAGREVFDFIEPLFPLCRSITGAGTRATLNAIRERLPLTIHEVPSGTPVLDWEVPVEWNIRDAWIKDGAGNKVIDFRACNLHVVNYSEPVHATMTLDELNPHLHSLPDRPDWIPYRTSYYHRTWGFCLSEHQRRALKPGTYEVMIDATLAPGMLNYGELLLAGARKDEVLISTHICHPSLANDNLSGIGIAVKLAQLLGQADRQYSYRFLFIPGTIGSITWLARNHERAANIKHGLVLSCLGDCGQPTYKQSRHGFATIDRAMRQALTDAGGPHAIQPFSPYGYDERQYGSPGFNLPVGLFMRSPHGTFPQYHTSADNLDFISADALGGSLGLILSAIAMIEDNEIFLNTRPEGEPRLGKYGLYDSIGGANEQHACQMAMLWTLNQSDGRHDLLDIARTSGLSFARIRDAAVRLRGAGLLEPAQGRVI